jgi:hypothetical protein
MPVLHPLFPRRFLIRAFMFVSPNSAKKNTIKWKQLRKAQCDADDNSINLKAQCDAEDNSLVTPLYIIQPNAVHLYALWRNLSHLSILPPLELPSLNPIECLFEKPILYIALQWYQSSVIESWKRLVPSGGTGLHAGQWLQERWQWQSGRVITMKGVSSE